MQPLFKKPLATSGFVIALLLTTACNRQEAVTPQQAAQATTTAVDNNRMVAITTEIADITQDGLISKGLIEATPANSGRSARKSGCQPSVVRDSLRFSRSSDTAIYRGSISIDYGDGTSCSDSAKVRKGKIVDEFTITIVGKLEAGVKPVVSYQEKITFENFQQDSAAVSGTFIKQSTDGVTTITTKDAKITYLDGTSVTWSGTLTYTYDNGGTAQDWRDDTQKISGSLSGTDREGTAYTTTITKDITYSVSCLTEDVNGPVSGSMEVSSGGTTSVVDYGDGTCDSVYTVTSNGTTTEYTFP